jgi:ketosteroid isomerase-like protein
MKIYVSGPVTDTETVQQVQNAVVAGGHELALDWSADVSFAKAYASQPERSAQMAQEELDAVMAADAVLVLASQHDGRGMFVELGAALTRASRGELDHVVLVGQIHHESVFYFHPLVQRVASVQDWLTQLP